ncbi:hypothetical protein RINTHM_11890 [Richelia intracellularis HM01]|nr:hypothetical protein RINTHM_11890 [Richelia intracellularis HM01]
MRITYRGGEGFTQSQCLFSDLKKLWSGEEWGAKKRPGSIIIYPYCIC